MKILDEVNGLVEERLGLKFAIDGNFFGEVKVSEFQIVLIGFLFLLYSLNHVAVGNYVVESVDVPVENLLLNLVDA